MATPPTATIPQRLTDSQRQSLAELFLAVQDYVDANTELGEKIKVLSSAVARLLVDHKRLSSALMEERALRAAVEAENRMLRGDPSPEG